MKAKLETWARVAEIASAVAVVVSQRDADPDNVPAASWERCLNYYFMQFNSWEYMYYQNLDDSIPRQLWVGADSYFKSLVGTKPGYIRFWKEIETAFDEPFRSYVTEEFRRGSPEPTVQGGLQ